MIRSNAVLVLLDALQEQLERRVRIPDLYLYSRVVLVQRAVGPEIADELRGADPSILLLLLEELEVSGLVEATGNSYSVTQKGKGVVEEFERTHQLKEEDLRSAAAAVA